MDVWGWYKAVGETEDKGECGGRRGRGYWQGDGMATEGSIVLYRNYLLPVLNPKSYDGRKAVTNYCRLRAGKEVVGKKIGRVGGRVPEMWGGRADFGPHSVPLW